MAVANDINDDAELIADHNEAWSLAVMKRGTSNMARAYIELRELASKVGTGMGPLTVQEMMRLDEIVHANDL